MLNRTILSSATRIIWDCGPKQGFIDNVGCSFLKTRFSLALTCTCFGSPPAFFRGVRRWNDRRVLSAGVTEADLTFGPRLPLISAASKCRSRCERGCRDDADCRPPCVAFLWKIWRRGPWYQHQKHTSVPSGNGIWMTSWKTLKCWRNNTYRQL